mgnify:CR=1 FL=1
MISAVGHEPDVTISDYVADRRASTPSNAAEIAVPDMSELLRYLRGTENGMAQSVLHRLEREERRLKALTEKRVLTDPLAFVQDRRLQLDYMQDKMTSAARTHWDREARRFAGAVAKLDALSPLKVLGRGYSIARNENGTLIASVKDAAPGERLELRLSDGSLACRVEERKCL